MFTMCQARVNCLHAWTHLIVVAMLQGRQCHYPHRTDEEAEGPKAKCLAQATQPVDMGTGT